MGLFRCFRWCTFHERSEIHYRRLHIYHREQQCGHTLGCRHTRASIEKERIREGKVETLADFVYTINNSSGHRAGREGHNKQ